VPDAPCSIGLVSGPRRAGILEPWDSSALISLPETSRARLEPDDYGWDHGGRGLRVSVSRACLARDFPCPTATAVQRLLTGTTAGREISDRPS
jgi:hypothetical protein